MIHLKCPTCKKITNTTDDATETDAVCEDCGTPLVVLKPVTGSGGKSRKKPASDAPQEDEDGQEAPTRPNKEKPPVEGNAEDQPKPKSKKKKGKKKTADAGSQSEWYSSSEGHEGEAVLGPRQEVFKPNNGILQVVAIVCGLMAAGGLLSCLLSTFTSTASVAIPVAVVLMAVGLGGLLWSLRFLAVHVAIHAGGIVHAQRGKSQIVPWEEISAVTQSTAQDGQPVYTLETKDFSRLVLNTSVSKDIDRLGGIILAKTREVILPQVRVKYGTGEMVTFGRLGINMEGMHFKKNVIIWREIDGVKETDGYLTVQRLGKWIRWHDIPISAVPNVHVLAAFVNEILAERNG